MAISHEVEFDYSWVGASDMHRGSAVYENITEQHAAVSYVCAPQIARDWLLRFGAQWDFFYFGNTGQAPLPNVLQQVNAILGFDYQFGDQWLMRLEWRPGIYGTSFQYVSGHDFHAPLVIGGTYLSSPDVQWTFGILVDLRSQFPVLPAPGVRWKFADQWTLSAIFPRPRLEYDFNDKLRLYLGLGVLVGTYTVPHDFGDQHANTKLNGATLDYFEYRVGGGCSWKLLPNLTLEAEAGALLGRWVSYVDKDVVLRAQPAPYAQVALHARF
jgi:opacity protein-like surface antigen